MLTREEFIQDRARVFDKVYGALSGLAIAAIAGIALNAILPGNDFQFGQSENADTAADFGKY